MRHLFPPTANTLNMNAFIRDVTYCKVLIQSSKQDGSSKNRHFLHCLSWTKQMDAIDSNSANSSNKTPVVGRKQLMNRTRLVEIKSFC